MLKVRMKDFYAFFNICLVGGNMYVKFELIDATGCKFTRVSHGFLRVTFTQIPVGKIGPVPLYLRAITPNVFQKNTKLHSWKQLLELSE